MGKVYKDIFSLEGMPPFTQFWAEGILQWQKYYRGNIRRQVSCKSISNESGCRPRATLNVCKFIAQEIANLVTAEKLNIKITSKTSDEITRLLQEYIDEILNRANLQQELGKLTEQIIAIGGGAISLWVDGERNQEGEIIANPHIQLRYYSANDIVPIKWTNSNITECALISHEAKNGKYYTRIELHSHHGTTYEIQNRLFYSDANNILGIECPITTLYEINPITDIEDMPTEQAGIFSYIPNITQNNIDFNSILGISTIANCTDTIEALDVAFDSFNREFVLGKKRILVPSSCIRTVRDAQGKEHRYFDSNDEAYEVLYADNPDGLKIQDNTVTLRVDEHIRAINALLDILAMQIGLSQGSLSFDKAHGLKTATEVASENAKTYRHIKRLQNSIATGIRNIIQGILNLSVVYGIEHNGVSIASMLSGGFELNVSFADGIIQDDSERQRDGIAMVNAGIISKRTFLINFLNYTPKQADDELAQVANEQPDTSMNLSGLIG